MFIVLFLFCRVGLAPHHFRPANHVAFQFAYLYTNRAISLFFDKKLYRVTKITLGHVGHLEATDGSLAVEVEGEEVEDVLDVADAVEVAVDVDVAILGR